MRTLKKRKLRERDLASSFVRALRRLHEQGVVIGGGGFGRVLLGKGPSGQLVAVKTVELDESTNATNGSLATEVSRLRARCAMRPPVHDE